MNDKQLKTRQRVSELLLDHDIQESSVLGEIEQLLESPNQRDFCSELLNSAVGSQSAAGSVLA